MRAELYKLILVFIMISFSFSLAFFLGREVAEKGNNILPKPYRPYKNQMAPQNSPSASPPSQKSIPSHTQVTAPSTIQVPTQVPTQVPVQNKPTQNSNKTNPLLSSSTTATNQNPQVVIPHPATHPATHPKLLKKNKKVVQYFILITRMAIKDQAINKVSQLKLRFPTWDLFVRKAGKMYNIYVGPFQKKTFAKEFLKEMNKKKEFSNAKIKKIILRKKN